MVENPLLSDKIAGDRKRFTSVFVYGTLLAGERNHGLLTGMDCLGADTLSGAILYNAGPYPYLRFDRSERSVEHSVNGEVYRVDGTCLARLDELEEHPHWYVRRWVRLASARWAWVYEGPAHAVVNLPEISSGDWRHR